MKKKTNYDVIIKNMTVERMADLIRGNSALNPCRHCIMKNKQCTLLHCAEGIKRWLEQKVL